MATAISILVAILVTLFLLACLGIVLGLYVYAGLVWLAYFGYGPLHPSSESWLSSRTWGSRIWRVRFGRQTFYVTRRDWKVRNWLKDVVAERRAAAEAGRRPTRLVSLVNSFRSIIEQRPVGGLIWCLKDWDEELQSLAVWLLGRCDAGPGVRPAVASFWHHPNPVRRRQVALALRRMADCAELYSLALQDPDPRVRQVATLLPPVKRSYRERLTRFVQHAGSEVFEPGHYTSHMPVFMLQPVGLGKPAKSRDWIRRILEHIRELVRSRFKNHAA